MTVLFKNTSTHFGLITILLHWVMAIGVIGLFILGQYMVGLDYYDPWYNKAPDLHKGIGIYLFVLLLFRLIWKVTQVTPTADAHYKTWERNIAELVHWLFYLLLLVSCVSGYYIATAKGAGIDLFGMMEIPAATSLTKSQAATVEEVHEISNWLIVILFILHFTAVLKHHLIDKDHTLVRMFKPFR